MSYFPELPIHNKKKWSWIRFSKLCNKIWLKKTTGMETTAFAKKVDLLSLKSNIDKLDIDKLEKVPSGLINLKSIGDKLDVDKLVPVPVDLSKLSDLVKSPVKKT